MMLLFFRQRLFSEKSQNAKLRGRRYWIRLAIFGTLTLVFLVGLVAFVLSWLLAYVTVHPLTKTTGETPTDYGLAYEPVSFVTADGLTLHGWHLPGRNGATVILVHGFARDRSELLLEASWLAGQGYGVLLFNARAHGNSDGAFITLGYREATDVRAAVDFISSRLPQERIGVLGYSMGAVAAIRAAAVDPRIQAVVAVSPFAELRDMVDLRLKSIRPIAPLVIWWGERMTGVRLDDLRPVDDVARLSPRPVLIMQAEADDVVPLDSGQRLYQAAREPKTLWSVPEIEHVGFGQAMPEAYRRRIITFFDHHLRPD